MFYCFKDYFVVKEGNNNWAGLFSDAQVKKWDSYSYKVRGQLIDIYCEEHGISEKAFSKLDQLIPDLEKLLATDEFMVTTVREFEMQKKRPRYCAEYLFDVTKDTVLKLELK